MDVYVRNLKFVRNLRVRDHGSYVRSLMASGKFEPLNHQDTLESAGCQVILQGCLLTRVRVGAFMQGVCRHLGMPYEVGVHAAKYFEHYLVKMPPTSPQILTMVGIVALMITSAKFYGRAIEIRELDFCFLSEKTRIDFLWRDVLAMKREYEKLPVFVSLRLCSLEYVHAFISHKPMHWPLRLKDPLFLIACVSVIVQNEANPPFIGCRSAILATASLLATMEFLGFFSIPTNMYSFEEMCSDLAIMTDLTYNVVFNAVRSIRCD